MSQQMMVFVSHAHEDDIFCRAVVKGLRGAGADVWYDEHNMASGRLGPTIERELRARPVFVVVLSPAALQSQWVEDETRWAYGLLRKDPTRVILPVLAVPLPNEDAIWLFLQDFRRIEKPGLQPYPPKEAVRRLLHALALTPAGEAPAPTAEPKPTESAEDLLDRGKALGAQQKYTEALPLFERATQLAPRSFEAWANLGLAYDETGRYDEALAAYDHALALDAQQAWVWNNKGVALYNLKRYDEALAAFDRATTLDPNLADAWNNKGHALRNLKRYDEALAVYDRAITLDPDDASAWTNRGTTLSALGHYDEAIAAYDKGNPWRTSTASDFDSEDFQRLIRALHALGRTAEAEEAERRAKEQRTNSTWAELSDTAKLLLVYGGLPLRLAERNFNMEHFSGFEVITPPLCSIPAGPFLMGSNPNRDKEAQENEQPQHTVTLPAYEIARFPVTVAEYECFVQQGHRPPKGWREQKIRVDEPVVNVTWRDAVAYAFWLAGVTKEDWRLPTEAEWEKAARGTDGLIYPWGDVFDENRCNTKESGIRTTTPVGNYRTGDSPYGVQDMAGNVCEWTSSLLKSYPYEEADGRENQNSTNWRVLRGGSFGTVAGDARAAFRISGRPDGLGDSYGFRLVRAAPNS